MKDFTPVPPSDSGFQLMEPMANSHVPSSPRLRPQKILFFLRKFWWMPVAGMILGFGTAVFIFFHTPPIFVSSGSLWETEKLRLPDGAAFTEDQDNYLGTQAELLRSKMLRGLTLTRMQALNTNQIILDKDGNP